MVKQKKKQKILQSVVNYARLDKTQFEIVDTLCFLSKNLYNVGLYNVRQHYHEAKLAIESMKDIRPDIMGDLCILKSMYIPYSRGKEHPFKDFSNYYLSKPNENFGILHSDVARQTLMSLDRDYVSFFTLLEMKLKGKYDKPIGTPHYLEKNGRYKIVFPASHITIKGNAVKLGMSIKFRMQNGYTGNELTFKIPSSIKPHQLREVTLLPVHNGKCYKIQFTYEVKKLPDIKPDKTKYLGIDLGVNNFATFIDNATGTATIIDGKYLKSLNRYYNKTNAKLQSIKDKQGNSTKLTRRQHNLLVRRECKIDEAMNRYVDYIVKHSVENHIGNIVCLRWNGIKQNCPMRKKNNQNFVQIPYDKFRLKLSMKCKFYGIKYHGNESEAYTSITDALALDPIGPQPYGKSRRIKRGLYKSSTGHVINADVNGAMNHIRKVAGDAPMEGIVSSGRFNRPVRVRFAYEPVSLSKKATNRGVCKDTLEL